MHDCYLSPQILDVFSNLNVKICSPHGSRPGSPTPQSDSELEMQRQSSAAEPTQLEAQLQAELVAGGKQSWKWGELPSPPPQPPRILSNEEESESQESGQGILRTHLALTAFLV
jgi:hypothetical protein